MSDDSGTVDAYERGDREEQQVRASLAPYRGQMYFSFRAWYRDTEGTYKPAKNGINLPKDEYSEFRKLVDKMDEAIGYEPEAEE